MADEQKRLQRAHRSWMLQKQSQDRESAEAANSLSQSVFHLSASFLGLTHQLLASQATVLNPSPVIACCFSNFSQISPPNIPHKHPFPLQKVLGKHMRESRQTKSKQKTGHCNLNLRSLTLCHQSFRSPPFQLNASITAANSLGPQPLFFYSALDGFFGK